MSGKTRSKLLSVLQRTSVSVFAVVALLGVGCDESDELRNIERGRDNPPAIDVSPPEEQN